MSYTLQVKDPEDLIVTVSLPGKYNPDILDDAKRRVVELYREVLVARMEIGTLSFAGDDEEQIDGAALLRALQGLDDGEDDD